MNPFIKQLIFYSHQAYSKNLVSATDGNLSARISDDEIIITGSSVNKGELKENDLVTMNSEGIKIKGKRKVSTEAKLHLTAYKYRKDINAVVHCHPPFATAFACIGEHFLEPVLPEVILSLGKVPLCKYSTPSTNEVSESIMPYIDFANALLLENHGAVTFGSNIQEAYFRMEKLEHYAQILFNIRILGKPKILDSDELTKLYEIAESNYNTKINKENIFI